MASPGGADPILVTSAVFLTAAVVAVPIFQRIKLGSVLGYLAAGAVIGPFGLGVINDVGTVLHIAEFGVVMLLFVIGLELKPARLWRLRKDIFGLGLSQIVVTGVLIAGISYWAGLGVSAAIVVGGALALSSTAFGVQILRERRELSTPYGDRTFSILLCQDLAIVPLFALVAFLAPNAEGSGNLGLEIAIALGAIGGLYFSVRYLLRPAFHAIAEAGSSEIFTATALLVVVGSALAMQAVGLSMALGAFIAGVLLAESEFRHQLETDIEPFRGLLLGLFFMGFGMTLDWGLIAENWLLIIGSAVGLFAMKAALLYGLTRIAGSNHLDSLRISATIGQGGEFAFVMITLAIAAGVFTGSLPSILSAIVTLSMIVTPAAVMAVDWYERRITGDEVEDLKTVEDAENCKVIVAGFGRVGQVVARIISSRGFDVTLIDGSPRRIRVAQTFGNEVFFGDARRLDILESAGAGEADLLFLCINDRDGAVETVDKVKNRWPDLKVYAETYDRFSEMAMRRSGVDFAVRQTYESAIKLAGAGLKELGELPETVEDIIEEFRRRDFELLELQTEYGADAGVQILRDRYRIDDGKRAHPAEGRDSA
ncbi:MAG: monovalent cation:proton antiporter-2 (CPA2) family protein [Pseudomonadota bacterium]